MVGRVEYARQRARDLIVRIRSKGPKFLVGVVALAGAAGIVTSVVLFVVPFEHAISGQIPVSFCAKCPIPQPYLGYWGETFPAGSSVIINWQSTSSLVNFTIYNPTIGYRPGNGCDERGVSGTCSFTADGGGYAFVVGAQMSETISWSGSYAAPIL